MNRSEYVIQRKREKQREIQRRYRKVCNVKEADQLKILKTSKFREKVIR